MWLRSLLTSLKSRPSVATFRRSPHRPRTPRLAVESLDDRCLPSTFTVTNLLDSGAGTLREAVEAANANPGADTIDFATTGTIALTSGQLDITDSLTINGPGAGALTVSGNHASRVLGIAGDPIVTIANLTIADGSTTDPPTGYDYSSRGGGVYMAGGTVTLDHVTVSGNSAVGGYGGDYNGGVGGLAAGGGLYVAGGTLTLEQCTVSGNSAIGGQGGWADFEYDGYHYSSGYDGGHGLGGGVYVAGGTVYVNQSTVAGNQVWGGAGGGGYNPYYSYGGNGGDGVGGGILVHAGALEIHGSSIFDNEAFRGGAFSYYSAIDGASAGGGLSIQPNAPPRVDLDTFTESHTINNRADIDPNISGPYTVNGVFQPKLTVSDVSTLEGSTGTHAITFTVSLSAASNQTITVNYATANDTANDTATAGSDYQAASGTLTFAPGETSKTITVQVIGDRLAESNETFFINLSSPMNAVITDGQGTGTIVDDEPRISISDVSKKEGRKGQTTQFTFTVSLSAPYDQPVTMSFKTTDGTARTNDQDYAAKTGTLTFAPGETSKTNTIEVKGDSKREADEYFYLDLFNNSSNSLFTNTRGIGTILNDD
jgi:hypothetical protein